MINEKNAKLSVTVEREIWLLLYIGVNDV